MCYLFRFFVDALYIVALYFGFTLGQDIGSKYMFTDMYIAKLYCGFIGVAVVVAIFSKIKSSLIFFVKAVGLYAISTKSNFRESFVSVLKRFDKILGVAVVTTLITEAVNDIKQAMTEEESVTSSVNKMFPFLDMIPFAGVIKIAGNYYLKSFTYVDECILAYSFAMNKPILQSVRDAFVQFLKNAHKIMAKLLLSNVVMTILNVILFVAGFIIYLRNFDFTLHGIIIFYIVIRAAMYVLDDAFVEPLLLQNVIEGYVDSMPSASETLAAEMEQLNESAESTNSENQSSDSSTVNDSETVDNADAVIENELSKLLELPAVKKLFDYTEGKKGNRKKKDISSFVKDAEEAVKEKEEHVD